MGEELVASLWLIIWLFGENAPTFYLRHSHGVFWTYTNGLQGC